MTQHKIGNVSDFPTGKATKVDIDGIQVVIFNIDGELYGINNLCPHKRLPFHNIGEKRIDSDCTDQDVDLAKGRINESKLTINCPWHYMEFELETGLNPVTNKKISTYNIVKMKDGDVYVEL